MPMKEKSRRASASDLRPDYSGSAATGPIRPATVAPLRLRSYRFPTRKFPCLACPQSRQHPGSCRVLSWSGPFTMICQFLPCIPVRNPQMLWATNLPVTTYLLCVYDHGRERLDYHSFTPQPLSPVSYNIQVDHSTQFCSAELLVLCIWVDVPNTRSVGRHGPIPSSHGEHDQ